jgi:ubiquinone/menaquinone biosynthesis C-methylase UbiE
LPIELDQVVPWGRSFDEYVRMFALTGDELRRSVLDCAAGPSSFQAELHRRGGSVVSVDPVYAFTADEIRSRVDAVRDSMMRQVRGQLEQFRWDFIRSPQDLERERMGAMEQFLEDYRSDGPRARYLPQSLPNLDFRDGTFDLALCSHFLFLYADHLDTAFHLASVAELLRVAREVRIFPVTDLSGKQSSHLAPVREKFNGAVVRVPYEFLKGANEMLVLKSSSG